MKSSSNRTPSVDDYVVSLVVAEHLILIHWSKNNPIGSKIVSLLTSYSDSLFQYLAGTSVDSNHIGLGKSLLRT